MSESRDITLNESAFPTADDSGDVTPEYSGEGATADIDALRKKMAGMENLWKRDDVPHTGWKCIGMTDLEKERDVCEMCGNQIIRYVHHMVHPDYRQLNVGCICAGRMEGDIAAARTRERDFKKKQKLRNDKKKRILKQSQNGKAFVSAADKTPYHKDYYLLYGQDKVPDSIDPDATKEFLHSIGINGGELKQARNGLNLSETLDGSEAIATDGVCSYCGRNISKASFYKLRDGRMRCTKCSRSLVENVQELTAIYNRTFNNLENFFGIDLKNEVKIEMVDTRKLKKKLKKSVGGVDTAGGLILGVAVKNRNEFTILLENGAPRITVISTIAHELTHIWQYTNWNRKELKKQYGIGNLDMIYEGMAMWTEIQYLYFIGEDEVAARLEAKTSAREDQYGKGFLLYADEYPISKNVMEYNETPFMAETLPLLD